jgi:hypothetical protein
MTYCVSGNPDLDVVYAAPNPRSVSARKVICARKGALALTGIPRPPKPKVAHDHVVVMNQAGLVPSFREERRGGSHFGNFVQVGEGEK